MNLPHVFFLALLLLLVYYLGMNSKLTPEQALHLLSTCEPVKSRHKLDPYISAVQQGVSRGLSYAFIAETLTNAGLNVQAVEIGRFVKSRNLLSKPLAVSKSSESTPLVSNASKNREDAMSLRFKGIQP